MKRKIILMLVVTGLVPFLGSGHSMAQDPCAVLSSGAAADLAIDDPEKFQTLSAQCKGSGRTGTPAASTSSARTNAVRSEPPQPKQPAPQQTAQIPEPGNYPPNCGYVFFSTAVPNGKHNPGESFCQNGKMVRCEGLKLPSKGWVQSNASCDGEPTDSNVYVKELNSRNLQETLQKMNGD
jgi:hypothetical protein